MKTGPSQEHMGTSSNPLRGELGAGTVQSKRLRPEAREERHIHPVGEQLCPFQGTCISDEGFAVVCTASLGASHFPGFSSQHVITLEHFYCGWKSVHTCSEPWVQISVLSSYSVIWGWSVNFLTKWYNLYALLVEFSDIVRANAVCVSQWYGVATWQALTQQMLSAPFLSSVIV